MSVCADISRGNDYVSRTGGRAGPIVHRGFRDLSAWLVFLMRGRPNRDYINHRWCHSGNQRRDCIRVRIGMGNPSGEQDQRRHQYASVITNMMVKVRGGRIAIEQSTLNTSGSGLRVSHRSERITTILINRTRLRS